MNDMCRVDIGVFAHDEEDNIDTLIATLRRQDILAASGLSVRVLVCANGCRDRTVERAAAAIRGGRRSESWDVLDLPRPGKSETWNHFVHEASRRDADFLIFCDADIVIPDPDMLGGLVRFLQGRPGILAASSMPVKDIAYRPQDLSLMDRVIASAGGTLNAWQKSICGQLYIMRAPVSRSFHLPVGLPVEDGFVRAMTLTNVFREAEDLDRIDGDSTLFHVYPSERTIPALIRHQTRLVIGSAINSVVYSRLSASEDPPGLLRRAAADPEWLGALVRRELPRRYGYVPIEFLINRLRGFGRARLRKKPVIVLGFLFDAVVYAVSQAKMFRGHGAGYW